MMSDTRKNLTVICTAKNEAKYLLEWIAFHRVVGVNHFYIYDNESTDETTEILASLQSQNIVTHIRWPSPTNVAKNVGAYLHFFDNYRHLSRWTAIIDCDEFLVPRNYDNLGHLLAKYEDFSGVAFHWKVFGSDGQLEFKNQSCMTRFFASSDETFSGNFHTKCIVKSELVKFPNVHISDMSSGAIVDTEFEPVAYETRGKREKATFTEVQINHYFNKSAEEWVAKKNRGRSGVAAGATDNIRNESMFKSMDQNYVYDYEIMRFYNVTINEMVRLAKLCNLERFLPLDALPTLRRSLEQRE